MSSAFTKGPGDQGSILNRVMPKIKNCYLILLCLALSIIR